MKIIMIRHGETTWNAAGKLQGREDVPLSEKGRLQAMAAGKALSLYPFSGPCPVIISSPLQRALETANLIRKELKIEEAVQIDTCLLERDYGAASGLTKEERLRRYPDWEFPGLEKRSSAEQRIVQGISGLAKRYEGRDLILVSHGEISHIFLARLRGEKTQTGRSALQNASISCLMYTEQAGFMIEYYNQTAEELEKLLKKGKTSMPKKIILASASPRRQELMQWVAPDFVVQVANIEEIVPEGLPVEEAPEYLAVVKAQAVAQEQPEALVIGSDTSVFIEVNGRLQILGKPKNEQEAAQMLQLLSGCRHVVRTGCCLCYQGKKHSFTEEAAVDFYPLSAQEIKEYIATGEPMDKAGAYGIQGYGSLLVKGIVGDFYTVMGLPVARLKRKIREFCNV